ncbi:MAG: plasmid mobilization relaxosome protein MobC [Propionibacterium sp.]|nr:plasmid mobilization relaxosome protein MobC [Propionibacterium sp.]
MDERLGTYRRRLTEGRREKRTVIKHTPEEWERVASLAKAQGVSVPRLYELAVHTGDAMSASTLTRVVGELHVIQRIMAGVATNLNQLARAANATGEVSEPQVLAAAEAMQRQVSRLRETIQQVPGGDLFK